MQRRPDADLHMAPLFSCSSRCASSTYLFSAPDEKQGFTTPPCFSRRSCLQLPAVPLPTLYYHIYAYSHWPCCWCCDFFCSCCCWCGWNACLCHLRNERSLQTMASPQARTDEREFPQKRDRWAEFPTCAFTFVLINFKHPRCDVENTVDTRLLVLRVILQTRVLRYVCFFVTYISRCLPASSRVTRDGFLLHAATTVCSLH